MPYGRPVAGFCVATALFACGLGGFPSPPDSVPPSSGSLALSGGSTTIAPGGTLSLSGSGFAADARVTIAIYSNPQALERVVADASGRVSATVTVPAALRGTHTVTALGDGPGNTARALEATVEVEPAVASSSAGLAYTGFDSLEWILGGLGLIVAGFVLVRTAAFRRPLLPARTRA